MKIATVQLSTLKGHPQNYREHPDDQLEHVIQSIKENGIYRPIVVSKDNIILAGHGVTKGLLKMGRETAPVFKTQYNHDHPKSLKILTGDNEMSKLGEVDDRLLSELLRDIKHNDVDGLIGTGFDDMMLANLVTVTRDASEIADVDHAAEWIGLPDYQEKENEIKVSVNFLTEEDKEAFFKKIGQDYTDKTIAIWFPKKRKKRHQICEV